ncbi:MAG: 6,7-dimethyl-8-ribityllumazine synthase [candidate division WS1 bacterium]|nr:6,7-dimethyl-8-ribityllumazine synthase [candidate division WS1 bacterium]
MKVYEGQLDGSGMSFGLVISRFNDFITRRLVDGCLDALKRNGASEDAIEMAYVPGAFEIPLAAKKMAGTGRFDAVITLGAVIRGSTSHFDFVAGQAARGVSTASMETGVPIIFGVITTETIEQAIERAGTRLTNRGFEAGQSAIEMVQVLKQLG